MAQFLGIRPAHDPPVTGAGGTAAVPPPSQVGELLQRTRLGFGQSLAEVARDIRIRQSFLEAIEGGRFETLPGTAYTIGFIRAYAEHLGLDPEEVVRRFKRETGVARPAAKLNFPAPLAESGVPKGAVLLLGAIIALIAYGIWYFTQSRSLDIAELTVPLPEHLRQILPGGGDHTAAPGGDAVPLPKVDVAIDAPASGAAPAAGTATAARPPSSSVPAPPGSPAPAAAPPPSSSVAAPPAASPPAAAPAPPAEPAAPPASPPTVASPPAATPAATVPAAEASRVEIRITADAWVEVRDPATRGPLVARLMRAGESFAVPDRPGLTLRTGNAGGTVVVIDGETLAPLGKPGAVRRGVPLDPEPLRATLAAAPAGE